MSGAGLAAAPALDGVLLRLPGPGILRLYDRSGPDGPRRHAAVWGTDLDRRHAWIPAACLREDGVHVLVLEHEVQPLAWHLPPARPAWQTPLTEALLRAALVMRSEWPPETWAEQVGLGQGDSHDVMARLLVSSGSGPQEEVLAAAIAVRASGRGEWVMRRAVELTERIGRETVATDAFLGALAAALGVRAPAWRTLDVMEILGLSEDWRDRSWQQLRTVCRESAFRTHPDRGGDPEQFMAVRAAWKHLRQAHQRHRRRGMPEAPETPGLRGVWGLETRVWEVLPAVPIQVLHGERRTMSAALGASAADTHGTLTHLRLG